MSLVSRVLLALLRTGTVVLATLAVVSLGCSVPRPSLLGFGCDEAHPCPADAVCARGVCATACDFDGECLQGEVCAGGACMPAATGEGEGEPPDDLCLGTPPVCAPRESVVCVGDAAPCNPDRQVATIHDAVDTGLPYVFLSPFVFDESVTISDRAVTIVSDLGSANLRSSTGPSLIVVGTADVTVIGVDVDSRGSNAVVVDDSARLTLLRAEVGGSPDLCITAGFDTAVTIQQSFIHDCEDGGLLLFGAAFVENSWILRNGNDGPGSNGSNLGGVFLGGPASAVTFRFNTLLDNASNGASALDCADAVFVDSVLSFRNEEVDIDSTCDVHFSNVEDLAGADADQNNFGDEPFFLDDGRHVDPSSPNVGRGNSEGPAVDVDGDPRPPGAKAAGADQPVPF